MLPHYGVLRDYRFEEEVEDLRKDEVYGVNDEKLGEISDVIFDHSTGDIRYVVLDTGGMFSRKKVIVPANRIEPYGSHEDKFYAELDKERLEMLPEYDDKMMAEGYDWSNYEKEYEKRWNDGAIMYNKDTGRIVTPPVEQVEGARRTPLTPEGRESLKRDFTPAKMGKEDDLLGVASGTGKTTLQPTKASKGGKEDVQKPVVKESRSAAPEFATIPEAPSAGAPETLREPRIYKVDEPPDERHPAQDNDNKDKGRRWSSFQNNLRARRGKIVIGCERCGSQEKVA